MAYVPGSTDPATNARFTDMGGGTTSETMAAHIQFFYDPTTFASRAIFIGMPYLNIASTYHALNVVQDSLQVDFTAKMTQCYGSILSTLVDPVTGADLTKISVAGIMILMKTAYDQEFNARADAIAAALAQAEAMAAANALLAAASDSPNANGTTVDFTSTPTGLSVAFQNTSTTTSPITQSGYSWIFGDGVGLATTTSPTYVYAQAGTYPVSLVVTDSQGSTTRLSNSVKIGKSQHD